MGACGTGGFGGCGACGATGDLPAGGLPTSQTVEGGAQMRVTPTGLTKLKSLVSGLLSSNASAGFCLPDGDFGGCGTFDVGGCYCYNKPGGACGIDKGCDADVSLTDVTATIPQGSTDTVQIGIAAALSTSIPIKIQATALLSASCTLDVASNNLNANIDVKLGIRPSDGELTLNVANINSVGLNLDISGCGLVGDLLDVLADIIDDIASSFLGQFVLDILTPTANDLLQSLLPQPLGIAGMADIGALMEGVSPGTKGFMEARIVPGGYASTANGGLNLGVITGLNADEDPSTRTGSDSSEPALCVPPLTPPDFSGMNLGSVFRSAFNGSTFTLLPAGQFTGSPDPTIPGKSVDLAMGISETTLDLAGHHLVTSGGMCLGVGTSLIQQLNVGTIGILVPSLGDLQSDEGNDPLLLVTRPQKSIDFTIGDNTTASPALTIHLNHMEVDFYAFLFERYTRAFTMDLTMNVGINLEFEQTATGTVIKPSLVGISSSEVQVTVLNSDFVAETPAELEGVLPSVFDLVTPLLGNLPDIPVPSFAGFELNPLQVTKVTTSQDDFLALYASLGPSAMMKSIAQTDIGMAREVDKLNATSGLAPAQPVSEGTAKLIDVHTPSADVIRGKLIADKGELPTVTFAVDHVDALGRELEWSWNLNGGYWRPFTSASPLVISDRAFAWQGVYEIGLKSRVKGDYRTTSQVIRQSVTIDSVGPKIFADKAEWVDGQLHVPAWDVVSGHMIEIAYGKPGEDGPATTWERWENQSLAEASAERIRDARTGELVVFARDERGNETMALVAPFHGQAGASGCSCETTGAPGAGSLLLIGLVGIGLLRRRRQTVLVRRVVRAFVRVASSRGARTVVAFVGMVAISSLVPACSCGKNEAQSCELDSDCSPDACEPGQLPFCLDNTCVCADDIPAGRIGPYSDVAVGGGQIWVSAYASTYGDLVVATTTGGRIPVESWEWVDGVPPDGAVVVPGSKIRGGIDEAGPDVGMYTSIQVAADGTPMVSYFDRTTASLKFAAKVGGVWQTHVVQQGTSQIDPGSGGSLVGMYTSMTLRTDDGRPGIAFLAHVVDADGERAEVRYAAAQTQFPTSSADWTFWTVDSGTIPENPDEIYPLPGGLGLFVDSARNPMNNAPVVVYYDRANGDLKLSRFNPASGQFAAPVVLDGSDGVDAGWSPAVAVDTNGVAHVTYVDATGDDLRYITDAQSPPKEIIDDGYRIVGQTVDGLPKPEFHFVGDDANIILPPGAEPIVVYQDATTQELLSAQRGLDTKWVRSSIAGATDPWPGAYGFFASAALGPDAVIMSSWVIDQPTNENWVEVFSKPFVVQ